MEKTMTFKVYLAGPIGGLSYDEATNGWRKHAKERLEQINEGKA